MLEEIQTWSSLNTAFKGKHMLTQACEANHGEHLEYLQGLTSKNMLVI